MSETTAHQVQTGRLVFARLFALPRAAIGAAYIVGYVLLDWISFVDPYAGYNINITPWNPPPGLSFVAVLAFGQRLIPYLFVAPFFADLINRQLPYSWLIALATSAIIGCWYSLGGLFLLRPKTRFNLALLSLRDLSLLLVTATISAALVAMAYVGALIIAGVLSEGDFFGASLRFWVGDVIGVVVVAPLGLMILTRKPFLKVSIETASQFAAILFALFVVFGLSQERHFQLFYVLFLPIIWISVRAGLQGVTAGILVAQIGLIVGVYLASRTDVDLMAFQALMLVLAITGLVAGTLVTAHHRTELQLRLHQESLGRFAHLNSIGGLAAALAHEINQPLMAAGTYSRFICEALKRGEQSDGIVEIADKVAAQVERASEVVKRLRALVTLNKIEQTLTPIELILNVVLDQCQPELKRNGIRCRIILQSNLPPVKVDILQIERVILNLVRNAIEAMNKVGPEEAKITIEAQQVKSGVVELSVRDTGPGFPAGLLAEEFPPFVTTKVEGLGIGLWLSRTIIEAHGGELTTGRDGHGTVVRLTLPAVTNRHD